MCVCVWGLGTELRRAGGVPIRTRYLGHVTGDQPIRDQYFLILSVPEGYHGNHVQGKSNYVTPSFREACVE